ncbi:6-hydroxymethylpterin diphosphokinase MptE-like protein [Helicobacter himalayensis]|uniref:6-hydroxymethylpterin diphosphokinase MptE-like protein n=1 Tax=Helicobacter himalayensis TaxID=1591088 RepID=UPI003D6F2E84
MNLSEILHTNDFARLDSYMSATFARNMAFFSALNPSLFARLKSAPTTHNLYFDGKELNIINLSDGAFVYRQGEMLALQRALAVNPLNNTSYELYTNNLALQKLDEEKIPLTAKVCNNLINLMFAFPSQKEFLLSASFLPSLTIFGALGGVFLQILLESGVYFHSLLLFEEYLDMFRIMLYFVDFELLFARVSEKSCYLFVENLINKEFVNSYFSTHKITNNFLRLELYLYESPKIASARSIVQEAYKINARGWGSFDDEMIGVRNSVKNFHTNFGILNLPKRVNVPICVVGNGVSLDSLLPFIKKNAPNMLIFSCGTALKPLKAYGIEPDFQIEIERISYLKEVLEGAPLGDTTLLCGSVVQPNAINLAKKGFLFMRGGSASAYMFSPKSVVEFSAPYVGNAGFALAALLGEEVLICGLDCGYIQGKSKHAKNSFYGKESSVIPPNAFEVRANKDKKVFSDALFSLSAQSIERAIKVFAPNLVLNLGEGAYLQGSRACEVDSFELRKVNKARAIKQIESYFQKDYNKVFKEKKFTDLYTKEVLEYKDELLGALRVNVGSKKELFALVDKVHRLSLKKSASIPFVGILFEGSIAHILHTLMVCVLHLSSDDISEFYAKAYALIEQGLGAMGVSYRLFAMQNKMAK